MDDTYFDITDDTQNLSTISKISFDFTDINDENEDSYHKGSSILNIGSNISAKTVEISLPLEVTNKLTEYQTVCKKTESILIQIRKYNIVFEAIKMVLEGNDDKLPADLKEKYAEYFRNVCLSRTLNTKAVPNIFNILGITEALEIVPQFSNSEIEDLYLAIKAAIGKIKDSVIAQNECFNKSTVYVKKDSSSVSGNILTEDRATFLNLINDERNTVDTLYAKLEHRLNLLANISNEKLKYADFQNNQLKILNYKLESLDLKTRILKNKLVETFLSENEDMPKAVAKLKDEKEAEHETVYGKLLKLRKMAEAYKKLEGTKFDKILSEYVNIRETMKRKTWTLNQLQQQ